RRPAAEQAFRRAIGLQERLVALYPAESEYRAALAGSYVNLGNFFSFGKLSGQQDKEASLTWYTKAVAFLEPVVKAEARLAAERKFLRNAYYGRGNAKLDLRRLGEAFDDFSRAIELDATNAPALWGRGVVYGLQGKPEKAVEDYSRAIQADPRF